jgi:hypothetical protein
MADDKRLVVDGRFFFSSFYLSNLKKRAVVLFVFWFFNFNPYFFDF